MKQKKWWKWNIWTKKKIEGQKNWNFIQKGFSNYASWNHEIYYFFYLFFVKSNIITRFRFSKSFLIFLLHFHSSQPVFFQICSGYFFQTGSFFWLFLPTITLNFIQSYQKVIKIKLPLSNLSNWRRFLFFVKNCCKISEKHIFVLNFQNVKHQNCVIYFNILWIGSKHSLASFIKSQTNTSFTWRVQFEREFKKSLSLHLLKI